MSNFKNINEEISKLEDIYTKKVSKKIFVLLAIAGVCVLYASTKMTGIEILGVLMFCIGFGMIIFGLVGISRPSEMLYCKFTKEILGKHIYYFDSADKNVVRAAIKEGNRDTLKLISNGQNNNMRAIVYATPSYSYCVFQMQTFVPHEYVPVEDVVICNTCRAN